MFNRLDVPGEWIHPSNLAADLCCFLAYQEAIEDARGSD